MLHLMPTTKKKKSLFAGFMDQRRRFPADVGADKCFRGAER